MQISGVSLTLTWPRRLCLLRVLLSTTATGTSFPLSKHTGGGDTAPVFSGPHVYLQLMWEVGLPLSPVEFSSPHYFYKLSCSWLLGMCHRSCFLGWHVYLQLMWEVGLSPSPVEFSSHCRFYKLSRSLLLGVCCRSCLLQLACCEGFPLPPLWCSGRPALFAMHLFCCY
jgi:hypothetical protein